MVVSVKNTGELIQKLRKQCQTHELKMQVPPDGAISSSIAIIAEAPGYNEVSRAMPLVGRSGQYLWDTLNRIGLHRRDCYITNVVKRQVAFGGANAEARDTVGKPELAEWEELLKWELKHLPNLRHVVLLGSFALSALTNETGITNWRGSVIPVQLGDRELVAVVANNPAAILRDPRLETIFRLDMHKLGMVRAGEYKKHEIAAEYDPSPERVRQYVEDCLDSPELPVSFDIETVRGETACVGFANNNHRGICINFLDEQMGYRFNDADMLSVWRDIQRLLSDERIKKVAQNAVFDCNWLLFKDRVHVRNLWVDTLLAHHTLYPQLPHNLGFLTSQYTTHPYYKDEGKDWRHTGGARQFWEYNVKDVCLTRTVADRLVAELRQQKLDKFFFEHVMKITPELVEMSSMGILVDVDRKEQIGHQLREENSQVLHEFHKIAQQLTGEHDYYPNPRSPAQMKSLFFNRLHLVGNGTSVNKENRDKIRKHPRTSDDVVRMLDLYDKYVEDAKFLSTYVDARVDYDDRIRCEYKQYGVASAPGRLSSSQTSWGTGMNLQNQPRRAYEMFMADEGYAFTYFDLSQAEARLVAYHYEVEGLMRNFELADTEGLDVHRANAARIFKLDYEDIPYDDRDENGKPTKRFLGKRCVHGLNYRMQAGRLATVCNIPINQAMVAFRSYHQAFPEIQHGWARTVEQVRKTRELYNAFGRRLKFLQRLDDDTALDSIIAFFPQSSVGDKVSRCIAEIHSDPRWPRLRDGTLVASVKLNIHDALIAVHPDTDEMRELCGGIMKQHAEAPIRVGQYDVVIPADLKYSQPDDNGVHRWSTIK